MSLERCMIGFVGVLGTGGFPADYIIRETARQHMKNPKWPPHAKFHNAQTILPGVGLGGVTLILICSPCGSSFFGYSRQAAQLLSIGSACCSRRSFPALRGPIRNFVAPHIGFMACIRSNSLPFAP